MYVNVEIDLHALLMNDFERRILRVERPAVHFRSTCGNTFMLCNWTIYDVFSKMFRCVGFADYQVVRVGRSVGY